MAERCSVCASEIEDGTVACGQCGAGAATDPPQLAPVLPASTEPAPLSPTTTPASEYTIPLPFSSTLLDSNQHLEGLSGWLLLVGFGLVVSPLMILGTTVATNLPLLTNVAYKAFLETHPAVEALIIFEVATNLIFVALLAALNFLFFKKKRSFPTYMIFYLMVHSLIVLGDAVAAHAVLPTADLPNSYTGVVRSLLGAMIWIPYSLVSRRVKVTFVN